MTQDLLSLDELSEHLLSYGQGSSEVPMQFALGNPITGEIRLGALWRTIGNNGWYAEVSNLPDGDYLDPEDGVPGLFRFFSDADLDEDEPLDTAEARFKTNLNCAMSGVFG
jgi:hypothetical protein